VIVFIGMVLAIFKMMVTYLKAQAASIAGSLADFLISILLVQVFHCWYIAGNAIGNICGSAAQFILSRNWAFNAGNGSLNRQAMKYILYWAGNILLQAAGVYFFRHFPEWSFIASKTITSIIIGLTYNYFAQKLFVFAGTEPDNKEITEFS
jgi:putative flippase GtrA